MSSGRPALDLSLETLPGRSCMELAPWPLCQRLEGVQQRRAGTTTCPCRPSRCMPAGAGGVEHDAAPCRPAPGPARTKQTRLAVVAADNAISSAVRSGYIDTTLAPSRQRGQLGPEMLGLVLADHGDGLAARHAQPRAGPAQARARCSSTCAKLILAPDAALLVRAATSRVGRPLRHGRSRICGRVRDLQGRCVLALAEVGLDHRGSRWISCRRALGDLACRSRAPRCGRPDPSPRPCRARPARPGCASPRARRG